MVPQEDKAEDSEEYREDTEEDYVLDHVFHGVQLPDHTGLHQ